MIYSAAMPKVRRLLKHCGHLTSNETVAIIADFQTMGRADVIAAAARSITSEVNLFVMPSRAVDGEEPPVGISEGVRKSDLVISLVSRSITHTSAIQDALAAGARALMFTAFTDSMLLGGGIDYDFRANKWFCEQVASLLSDSNTAHLTSPGGTDLTMDIGGRPGNAHSGVVEGPGQMTTVPNVESSVSPLEGSSRGVIVGDASIPYYEIGLLQEPVMMNVQDGRVADVSGGYQAQLIARMMEQQNDPNVYNIAQLSFGLNPECRMQGVMLEDEGVYGTSHIGIGTSSLLGGTIKAKMHYDIIMWRPTLELDGKVVLRDGEWLMTEH